MGWKGAAIGGYVGSLFGGPFGAVFGAYLGHNVENRLSGQSATRRQRPGSAGRRTENSAFATPLDRAYAAIGASPSDGPESLKRRYRELAKRNHPDAMRARGAAESEIEKATRRMTRINEAWAEIRSARGI